MVREMQHCMNGHTQTRGPTKQERDEPITQSTSSFLFPYTSGSRSPWKMASREMDAIEPEPDDVET